MSENLGDAVLRLSVDDSGLDKGLDAAGKRAESRVSRAGKNIAKAGAGLTAGLTLPILAFGKLAAGEMGEIEAANNLTAAAIRRVGEGSLVSVAGVQKLAGALQAKSGIDDQAIQSASNMLLTLGAIDTKTRQGSKTFRDATTTAVNMAEALGQDVGSAGKQVAKSMAAAAGGTLLLPRGMKLAAGETKRVEAALEGASTAAERQAIVVDVLGKKFAGAANLTNADRWAILKDRFAGIGATLLTTLMPSFQKLTDWLGKVMSKFEALSPGTQSFIAKALLVGAVLGPLLIVLGAVVTAVAAIGLPVLAVVAALGVLGVWLLKSGVNLNALKAKVVALGQGFKQFVAVFTGEGGKARSEMNATEKKFAAAAEVIKAAFAKIKAFIAPVLGEIRATLTVWGGWASSFWNAWGGDIMRVVSAAFSKLAGIVGPYLNGMKAVITAVLRLVRGDFDGAWAAIKTAAASFFTAFVAQVRAVGGLILSSATAVGSAIIDGIMAGLRAGKDAIINYVTGLGSDALNAVKGKLGISSPSKVFAMQVGLPMSQGIALGLQQGTAGVVEALRRQIDRASDAAKKRLDARMKRLEEQMRVRGAKLSAILGQASMGQTAADLWSSQRGDSLANLEKVNAERERIALAEKGKLQAHLKANAGKMSLAERQDMIARIAQINNDVRSWKQEVADRKAAIADAEKAKADEQTEKDKQAAAEQKAEEDRLKQERDDAENLRREALGLPSLEEEAHRNAINAIRAQYGLPLLDANGQVLTPAGTGTDMPGTTTATDTGATTAPAAPVVIYQTFSGEPDLYAASRRASFAYRTIGMGVA
jgi:hypothetical protein